MAYEPTNWKSGDVVTSAKLNKLEQGVVDAGAFTIDITAEPDGESGYTATASKTNAEIAAAYEAGATLQFSVAIAAGTLPEMHFVCPVVALIMAENVVVFSGYQTIWVGHGIMGVAIAILSDDSVTFDVEE